MRRTGWRVAGQPVPKRPFRDSLLFHLVLAALLVVVAYLTRGDLTRAFLFAALFFVVATAWSWWRWRQRLERERQDERKRGRARPARAGRGSR